VDRKQRTDEPGKEVRPIVVSSDVSELMQQHVIQFFGSELVHQCFGNNHRRAPETNGHR
jgi:hypothetical protein